MVSDRPGLLLFLFGQFWLALLTQAAPAPYVA
jgi:hypothetical protein